MAEASRLDGITDTAFSDAVAATVDLLRASRPELDLRAGTAIRALVVEPAALAAASLSGDIAALRASLSLESIRAGVGVSREDAAAVLSNFGVTLGPGAAASGLVRIVTRAPGDAAIAAGTTFTDGNGAVFSATTTTRASTTPVGDETPIIARGDGTYYYTVPVSSDETGSGANILQGTVLTPSVAIGGLVFCDAYSDFTGGSDGEGVAAAIDRIPATLAARGLTNAFSVEATLTSRTGGSPRIHALSCVGYRSRAMLRDRHNVLGVSVGGRVDVYVRAFDAPQTVTVVLDGVRVESSDSAPRYRIDIPATYRGAYAVKRVCRADFGFSGDGGSGLWMSLPHRLERGVASADFGVHDFDVSDDACETAWSVWQSLSLVVDDLPYYAEGVVDGVYKPPATARFKVEIYHVDGLDALQAVVDAEDVRNVSADHVVRYPPICLVDVVATVRPRAGAVVSPQALEACLADYINGRSFTGRLTRSELANVLLQHGVESVDLGAGGMALSGRVCGADGVWYTLSGDALSTVAIGAGVSGGDRNMLDANTVVFAAEPESMHVSIGK